MDALRRSIFNCGICQERSSGEGRENASAEPTTFNIISAFALENGTVEFGPEDVQPLSEEELVRRFPRELPPLRQTEQWHQRLAETVSGLPGLLASKPQGTTATLNVIYVHHEKDSVRDMCRGTLLKLFEIFELDPSVLHLLRRGADTWHCIRRDDTCAFLFIIQSLYRMACSFSPNGRETNCVIFGSPPKEIENDLDKSDFNFYQPAWFCKQRPPSDSWVDNQSLLDEQKTFEPSHACQKLLEKIQSHHLHHPLSLAYLGLEDSLSSIFLRVRKEVEPIGELEDALDKATEPIGDDKETLGSLVSLFEKAGTASVTLARLSKVTGVASMLLQTLQDRKGWKRWCRRFLPTNSGSQYDHAAEWLAKGLPSCRQILQNEKLQIQSQDERVKALTPIVSQRSDETVHRNGLQKNALPKTGQRAHTTGCKIFALISRADAQSGLTIAVMTMTFLPATAIAAIMAVPWDRGDQRTRNLQAIIYCVVTFFMTLAVFFIWMRGATWFSRGARWFSKGEKWLKNVESDAKRFKNNLIRSRKAVGRATDV